MISLAPFLTPHGMLALSPADDAGAVLAPTLSWWRDFGVLFVTALCASPGASENGAIPAPAFDAQKFARLGETPPIMTGAEYLTADVLAALWMSMSAALSIELAEPGHPLQDFLKRRNPAWNLVGRVHFNLAEGGDDEIDASQMLTWKPAMRS